MSFTHPELLWALLLLLIPLIVHLFQLRRFRKTPFTNVRFLREVVTESRRSKSLKRYLLLASRLLLLACLVLAFRGPYLTNPEAQRKKETVVYLDNSFSMQATDDQGSLLESAVQQLLASIPRDMEITVFSNTELFREMTSKDLSNNLLAMGYTQEQLTLAQVLLKARSLFNDEGSEKNLLVISDFQARMSGEPMETEGISLHLVPARRSQGKNIAVDSVYLDSSIPGSPQLTAILSSSEPIETIPVSLFNGDTLIAKTAAAFNNSRKASVPFSLSAGKSVKGRVVIDDTELLFDNDIYFTINDNRRIKVMVIGDQPTGYLSRIYTGDEFDLTIRSARELNFGDIPDQNLVILNQLPELSRALGNSISSFHKSGGSVLVIPSGVADLNSYNELTKSLANTEITGKIEDSREITTIQFGHPLLLNLFEREITNFQYPQVNSFYRVNSRKPEVLGLQGDQPFLLGSDRVYLFTAPLDLDHSSFQRSPLIVPVFYSMGKKSLAEPELYYTIGRASEVDIPVSFSKDQIVKLALGNEEFIPLQQSFAKQTRLYFNDQPEHAGNYQLRSGDSLLGQLSFNYQRTENSQTFIDPGTLGDHEITDSIRSYFVSLEKAGHVTELWKWFVILALLFLLAEILIQKFIP
ncbi:BatA domain-containing protein [Zeaxanthinibacter enoshimensis]|uniref:Putative membrane protein (TIGR02226 family) n=1 Tax=Zeaxanthinibacter enoshimensis TaxID=392009 RepID=A0A4V3D3V7_9FLAO|nr:BatA domain-containing protein [Zeaxanthinibacter enoshimensis]TDQ31513.1 putative membrane protein (TIGR02226 family) [Zeaxanthinibacter enoshimensis]